MTPQEIKDLENQFEQWYQEDAAIIALVLHTESNNLGIRKNRSNWLTSRQELEEIKQRDEELLALLRFVIKKLEETKP